MGARTDAPPASLTPLASSATSVGPTPPALERRLGFWPTAALVVGTIIGSGIFRVPASVAADVGSVSGIAIVWILGGVIALAGALSMAELAAAFPHSGGVFVYLREAYGDGIAFLFGWTMLLLGPASAGAIALVFAEYLGTLAHLSQLEIRTVAAAAILVVGAASYVSVRGMGIAQGVASVAKVGAIVAIVAVAFALGDGGAGSLGRGAPSAGATQWGGVGLGLVAALWAYNGFQDSISIAGEVRNPQRVLPLALLVGNVTVVAVYLAANAAYVWVLPFDTLRASPLVASDAMVRVMGSVGASAVAAAVMISTFGALNGLALVNPRVFYAMAESRLLFAPLARVHPRYGTPHVAVLAHTAIAFASVWSQSFEQLASAFVLGIWPFLALAAAGVLVLRRTRPELARPYLTPLYPVLPLVFVAGTMWVVGSALIAHPLSTLGGFGFTLAGVPVYLAYRRYALNRREAPRARR